MNLYINAIDDIFFSTSRINKRPEMEQTKEMERQFLDSIEWLNILADQEKNQDKKTTIKMEITVANSMLSKLKQKIKDIEITN